MRPIVLLVLLVAAPLLLAQPTREPVVGLPCRGCEAVFEGISEDLDSQARIAPEGEAGEPMRVRGTVFDRQGRPRSGIVVYAYQTDARGLYPPAPDALGRAARRHGRLRAWVRTDAEGRYGFDTIRPGSYPDSDVAQHIHLHVIEPGCATYYIDDIQFNDDPKLSADGRTRTVRGRGGDGIATPLQENGVWSVERDIHLGRNIPGHPGCAGQL